MQEGYKKVENFAIIHQTRKNHKIETRFYTAYKLIQYTGVS